MATLATMQAPQALNEAQAVGPNARRGTARAIHRTLKVGFERPAMFPEAAPSEPWDVAEYQKIGRRASRAET